MNPRPEFFSGSIDLFSCCVQLLFVFTRNLRSNTVKLTMYCVCAVSFFLDLSEAPIAGYMPCHLILRPKKCFSFLFQT